MKDETVAVATAAAKIPATATAEAAATTISVEQVPRRLKQSVTVAATTAVKAEAAASLQPFFNIAKLSRKNTPIVLRSLIDSLGWRGGLAVTGSLVLSCVAFGALFRPIRPQSEEEEEEAKEEEEKTGENVREKHRLQYGPNDFLHRV